MASMETEVLANGHGTGGTGGTGEGHDYDLRAYAEVTRERVDNVADHVQRLERKIDALVMLLVGQMLAFVFAVGVVLINHVKF